MLDQGDPFIDDRLAVLALAQLGVLVAQVVQLGFLDLQLFVEDVLGFLKFLHDLLADVVVFLVQELDTGEPRGG